MEKAYVPSKEDFAFLPERNLEIDENFASQGYWESVATHFFHNRLAVTGLVLVGLTILFAVLAPMVSTYSYQEIVSVTDAGGKEVIAKSLSPQFAGGTE